MIDYPLTVDKTGPFAPEIITELFLADDPSPSPLVEEYVVPGALLPVPGLSRLLVTLSLYNFPSSAHFPQQTFVSITISICLFVDHSTSSPPLTARPSSP